MYGPKTVPHMYVVSLEGALLYKGGIGDKPATDEADIEGATNYVVAALDGGHEREGDSGQGGPALRLSHQIRSERKRSKQSNIRGTHR